MYTHTHAHTYYIIPRGRRPWLRQAAPELRATDNETYHDTYDDEHNQLIIIVVVLLLLVVVVLLLLTIIVILLILILTFIIWLRHAAPELRATAERRPPAERQESFLCSVLSFHVLCIVILLLFAISFIRIYFIYDIIR